MRFQLRGKVYTGTDVMGVELIDILKFEQSTRALGSEIRWSTVTRWVQEIHEISSRGGAKPTAAQQAQNERDVENHESSVWLFAIMVWASRRKAGDDIDFADSLDFSMADITFLKEPEDRKPAANPTKARPRSGRAAKPRPAVTAPAEATT